MVCTIHAYGMYKLHTCRSEGYSSCATIKPYSALAHNTSRLSSVSHTSATLSCRLVPPRAHATCDWPVHLSVRQVLRCVQLIHL